jgi:hypothetical protein
MVPTIGGIAGGEYPNYYCKVHYSSSPRHYVTATGQNTQPEPGITDRSAEWPVTSEARHAGVVV